MILPCFIGEGKESHRIKVANAKQKNYLLGKLAQDLQVKFSIRRYESFEDMSMISTLNGEAYSKENIV